MLKIMRKINNCEKKRSKAKESGRKRKQLTAIVAGIAKRESVSETA